ncbi:DUF3696 domain-containing protein [Agrobacterium tumefaciens]|uniref:AAA family ATPase n=1 Tax=Agrobacterium tumefaciens TaxID=358 RepID=UPI001297BA0C|nr:DUF3696 domain-containing protein [Agrobacterium tumefaciens]MQB37237.1 DUF3696 domain-containing protein [Agrobacterium tumefaciens]
MLLEWKLKDFKSFRGENVLKLAPLTILCGANSSGKSSLIQSMLLIKQTLQHSAGNRTVALNGPLVRLGTLSDIENSQSRRNSRRHSVSIGWKFAPQVYRAGYRYGGEADISKVSVSFSFDAHGPRSEREALEIQPVLASCELKADYTVEDEHHELHLVLARPKNHKGQALPPTPTKLYDVRRIDPETANHIIESLPKGKIVGSSVQNFLPYNFEVRYDKGRQDALKLGRLLFSQAPSRRALGIDVPSDVSKVLSELWRELKSSELPITSSEQNPLAASGSIPVSQYQSFFSRLSPPIRRNFTRILEANRTQIEKALVAGFSENITTTQSTSDVVRQCANLNDFSFRFGLQYVGPLRDEPKPIYALQALSTPTDVGPKGELTAAVLQLNEKRSVIYVPASCFQSDEVAMVKADVTLREALVDWLKYLGIAHDFNASEKGKFGHELQIKTHPSLEFQDLTNVGVGVSQVLPVLVACLLADPGSTIILEQPELHLHPAVQARLADFFISMGLLGKQCIIETHGEHIIDRLRFRIASAEQSDFILENLKIFSFQQSDGSTSFEDIEISKYGAIKNWPEGFFDQGMRESERIIQKQLERRKKERELLRASEK